MNAASEIDEITESHSGWPDAFQATPEPVEEQSALWRVAEPSFRYNGDKAGRKWDPEP